MGQRKVRGSRLHAFSMIFRYVCRTLGAIVFHEERTAIDIKVRTQLSYCCLINFMTVERTANGLRDPVRHRFALRLLGQEGLTLAQRLFRMFTLSQVAPDSLDAYGFPISKDQTCTDFEPDASTVLRNDVEFVDRRFFIGGFLDHHLLHET